MSRLIALPVFVFAIVFLGIAMMMEERLMRLGRGFSPAKLLGWSLICLFVMAMLALGSVSCYLAVYGVPIL